VPLAYKEASLNESRRVPLRLEQKLFWIARGYRPIAFIEICCVLHGSFRSGLQSEQDEYPCPVCRCVCKAIVLGEGVTRKPELNVSWELVEAPLWSNVKAILLATPDELVKPRKPKPRKPLLTKGQTAVARAASAGKVVL
jgi:hypothetical protein